MTAITDQVKWRRVLNHVAADLIATVIPQRLATATQGQVDADNASTQVLAANAARVSFLVKNISSVDVYVYLGDIATTVNGILLYEGDVIAGDCYTGKITAITAAGTATLSYIEV